MTVRLRALLLGLSLLAIRSSASAQDRGAVAVDQLVRGLTNTARVLVIGAHPDDEDTQLITWLARGRQVETAYLSLTRGDGGQNLIGNELGEALGAIRTEELLAARRLDGGRQYFARAFDFGFSKTAEETFKHWDHDSLLGDVVTVIRSFRPHVVVSVWSGTPADGHGHHTVSGILSRQAYDAAGDTVHFPVAKYGQRWEPLKFYRGARFNGVAGSLAINVGEYDPVVGRGYGEIAAESRAQHRSQGMGRAQLQRGALMDVVARQGSRVNESTPPANERSILDGVDTSFARLVRISSPKQKIRLETVRALADSARTAIDLEKPSSLVKWIARAAELAQRVRVITARCSREVRGNQVTGRNADPNGEESDFAEINCDDPAALDLDSSLEVLRARTAIAVLTVAGVVVEANAPSELLAFGDSMPVALTVYNRGREPVTLLKLGGTIIGPANNLTIAPDSAARLTYYVSGLPAARPWWPGRRDGDMFPAHDSPADGLARASVSELADSRPRAARSAGLSIVPGVAVAEDTRRESELTATLRIAGSTFTSTVGPVIYRSSDAVLGEQNRPVGGVPPLSLTFDGALEWIPTGKPIDRRVRLTIKSYAASPRTMRFETLAPAGIRVDSLPPSLTLAAGDEKEIFLRLRGQLKAGRYQFGVVAVTPEGRYGEGFRTIEYAHIRPIRLYRSSAIYLQAVDIAVPAALSVAYVQGVGDASATYLRQLDIPVTMVQAAELPLLDLSRFSTVVVGPRAYEAHRELEVYNARLLDFAKKGGTVVVQYGQTEMTRPGVLPYPITLARPARRVTEEDAPVTVVDPKSSLLSSPNKIADSDWARWVQERAVYMPSTIDPHWATPLEMHDPGEPPNNGALLVAPLGKGMYVYTTLALFRQLPAGVPGGPRIFVNLLSAGLDRARMASKPTVQP